MRGCVTSLDWRTVCFNPLWPPLLTSDMPPNKSRSTFFPLWSLPLNNTEQNLSWIVAVTPELSSLMPRLRADMLSPAPSPAAGRVKGLLMPTRHRHALFRRLQLCFEHKMCPTTHTLMSTGISVVISLICVAYGDLEWSKTKTHLCITFYPGNPQKRPFSDFPNSI